MMMAMQQQQAGTGIGRGFPQKPRRPRQPQTPGSVPGQPKLPGSSQQKMPGTPGQPKTPGSSNQAFEQQRRALHRRQQRIRQPMRDMTMPFGKINY
jgi:hypothetical protein